jgi:hypothetical protein
VRTPDDENRLSFFVFFLSFYFLHTLLVSLPCCLACLVTLPHYLASLPHHFIMLLRRLVVPRATLLSCCLSLPRCLATSHCLVAYCYLIAFLSHVTSLPSCLVVWSSSCFVPLEPPPFVVSLPRCLMLHYLVCLVTLYPMSVGTSLFPFLQGGAWKSKLSNTHKKKVSFFFLFSFFCVSFSFVCFMSPSSFFLLELFLFFYSCNMFVQKCNLLFCLFYVQGIYKPKFVLKNNHYISLYIFVILMREK